MGGLGGKGKGARRRNKLAENAKVFDKKAGTFRYVVVWLRREKKCYFLPVVLANHFFIIERPLHSTNVRAESRPSSLCKERYVLLACDLSI